MVKAVFKEPRVLKIRQGVYPKYGERKEDFHRWVLDKVPVRSYKRILDIGAGSGEFLAKALNYFADSDFVAMDLNPAMLKRAKKLATRPISTVCTDVHHLPLSDKSINLVFANHMLYYTDPEISLAEIARVMADDAILACTTNSRFNVKEILELHSKVLSLDRTLSHNYSFDIENGQTFLSKFFSSIVLHLFTNRLIFNSKEKFMDFYSALWIFVNQYGNLNLKLPKAVIEERKGRMETLVASIELPLIMDKTSGLFISSK
ncbi:MAG: methyltransferase domain-containing protein [Candidatus Micrarchaeota archaeon]